MGYLKRLIAPVTLLLLMLLTAVLIQPERNSVTVHFRGLEQQTYYVTLLSDVASTGAWGGVQMPAIPWGLHPGGLGKSSPVFRTQINTFFWDISPSRHWSRIPFFGATAHRRPIKSWSISPNMIRLPAAIVIIPMHLTAYTQ